VYSQSVSLFVSLHVSVCLSVWLDVSASVPFSVEPENGVIAAGKMTEITVKFSPLDVSDHEAQLVCR